MIEFGHGTHVGLRRTRNEDTYFADPALGLFLVADGMGGHQHGEVASAMARDAVAEQIRQGKSLVEAVHAAALRLESHARQSRDALPMGTTLAALHVDEEHYQLAWVGDSRIYRLDPPFRQVSHDHSLVQELINAGRLDPELAARHPQRNVLTQALGITAADQLHVGMARGTHTPGVGFLLCTDGLTEGMDDAALARIATRGDLAAQECVDHLLLDALDASGNDNVTVILVRLS
ncbi:PP2C family protein-serine/threonine phosphatase [Dyella sp.]|jgi:protein phosphatase|uniref:PP2C family protein-serine/threonine phosphatase n=1 Tax=Dyella sp. TaxID=1869338 RepID=UPI002D78D3CA|nr:protein phosphatase 2C domain-containing protein [Dyella sp.]HET6433518.1 protein phosphatase 2C domain-containing protein [Dyella sp.]